MNTQHIFVSVAVGALAEWSHVPVACIYSIRMPRAPLVCKYRYGVLADCLAVLVWANVRTMTAECLSDVGPH
jgi:hypothetical protein